jgi:hypothetical protein
MNSGTGHKGFYRIAGLENSPELFSFAAAKDLAKHLAQPRRMVDSCGSRNFG